MLNKEREQEIMSLLKTNNGFVTVRQLCELLFASESSIRRDLKSLEERGLIKRSYGGAALAVNHSHIVAFSCRTGENALAKREIAKKAAHLIKDGSVIFLDQSSSAFYLANELINKTNLTVITNNIEIMILLSNSGVHLISSGGFLSDENRNCLIGGDARETFENVWADTVFFSVKAIDDDGLVTDCSREEIVIRNAMLKNARQKVLLCDSSKFGIRTSFKQCDLGDVDYLISEGDSAQRFLAYQDRLTLL